VALAFIPGRLSRRALGAVGAFLTKPGRWRCCYGDLQSASITQSRRDALLRAKRMRLEAPATDHASASGQDEMDVEGAAAAVKAAVRDLAEVKQPGGERHLQAVRRLRRLLSTGPAVHATAWQPPTFCWQTVQLAMALGVVRRAACAPSQELVAGVRLAAPDNAEISCHLGSQNEQ
jgi:hypothetical protein